MFGGMEIEKKMELYHHKSPILLKDVMLRESIWKKYVEIENVEKNFFRWKNR